ncbi:MAG: type II secretion system F family protein [Phycisphaeraceae bacterium]|nr:MAG: type II secretion system F family protein [Phycisphaeraceae bacterium]
MSPVTMRYDAIDRRGRSSRGRMVVSGQAEAIRRLGEQGLTPVELTEVRRVKLSLGRRISGAEIAAMTRELSVLIDAHVPIGRGMASMAEQQANPVLRGVLRETASAIESGLSITEALSAHRGVFGEVYIETIRAAERSGSLGPVMAHLADMLERQLESRQTLRRALTYPAVVLCAVVLAIVVILVFVVPRFAATFSANGVQLPLMTRIVQTIGFSMREHWWMYLLGVGAAVWFSIAAWRSEVGRRRLEAILPHLPRIGKIVLTVTTARFMRVVSIALEAGVDLTDAIQMGGRATGRPLFARECAEMADGLRGGESLENLLAQSAYLPAFARRMIAAGRDARDLARASHIVSEHYDREADHLSKSISTLIEPLMTLGLATVVLVVALSVFLPMWQMVRMSH